MIFDSLPQNIVVPDNRPAEGGNSMLNTSGFAHRHNLDSTFDSICTGCFCTIATARTESELAEAEKEHACEPSPLCEALLSIVRKNLDGKRNRIDR